MTVKPEINTFCHVSRERCGSYFNAPVSYFEEHHVESKHEMIQPKTDDKSRLRRDKDGHFTKNEASVGRSLAADQKQHLQSPVIPTSAKVRIWYCPGLGRH